MLFDFCKMHSLGNDFVIIDAITQQFNINSELAKHIANRKTGIGCDQLLIIMPPVSDNIDLRYQIFNQDGTEAKQCGNGVRCIARFAYETGLVGSKEITTECVSGKSKCVIKNFNNISANLGKAQIKAQKQVSYQDKQYHYTLVNIGNNHAVLVLDKLEPDLLPILANLIQAEDKVNVNFVQIKHQANIEVITYEAGVGRTDACGSGSCASVAIGIERHNLSSNVKVNLKLGYVHVNRSKENNFWLSGPTRNVFYGKFRI